MTKPIFAIKVAAAGDQSELDTGTPPRAARHHRVESGRILEELQSCLNEQIRLLAAAPEFDNKRLVLNCAKVSLIFSARLASCKDRA